MTGSGTTTAGFEGRDRLAIGQFIVLDRIGTVAGIVLLVLVNGLSLRVALIWAVLPALLLLLTVLTVAERLVSDDDRPIRALGLIMAGNWVVAIVVAVVLPFLWPVMVLTVVMPLVLATPYLHRKQLLPALVAGAVVSGLVATTGLLADDGGALPDIEDEFELVLVVGALMAQIVPIALIVWQNNRLQQENLERAVLLNVRLLESQDQLANSRRRVVQAADSERRRIERNLHDGAQQRLVALGVRLRLLESQTTDLPTVRPAVEILIGELDDAIEEVRELAHGIYPPLLQSRGLGSALTAVARRSPLSVTSTLDDVGRLHPSTETALYFTALEALTNAAKHAPESTVDLTLVDQGLTVLLSVADNGPGFATDRDVVSHGIQNMEDRIAAIGGELSVMSQPGAGTTVTAIVPNEKVVPAS